MNVFTRSLTDDLASLVKQLDNVVGENQAEQMAGFVVLLTDDPDAAEEQVKAFAKKHDITNVPVTVFDGSAGPPNYKISQDADVTVLLWRRIQVKANHAFQKGELDENDIASVVDDTKKILN